MAQFETARWNTITPRGREIVSYVALTRAKLSLADLINLVSGSDVTAETVTTDVEVARWFLSEDVYGYSIRHEHQRDTVLRLLSNSPQKHSYYARGAAGLLRERGDYTGAFLALESAGVPETSQVARAAAFDAARQGDYRSFVHIGRRIIASAREEGDRADLAQVLLDMAFAEQQLGHKEDASLAVAEAEAIAADLQNDDLILRARECRARIDVSGSWSPASVAEINLVRDAYKARGDTWSFGRMALEISAMLIRADRYEDAADEARIALATFKTIGDNYGISLAIRNLASVLTGISGRESEVAELIDELRRNSSGPPENKRERAWLCNIMVRRFRRSR